MTVFASAAAGASMFACLLGACKAETAAVSTPSTKPVEAIIATVANNQTFRMRGEDLEKVLAPYCKKSDTRVIESDTRLKFICNKESGITELKFIERSNEQQGRFIFSLVMMLPLESYSPLKTQTQKQLGKPARSASNYLSWRYAGDQRLNTIGNPMFRLERFNAEKVTMFEMGIEAGP